MAMQYYALPPTNLGISAAAVSHGFMFPQPPPPILVTRIWRRVHHPQPQPAPLWRLVQYPYGIHHVIMTPPFPLPAYHHQYPPPRPRQVHQHRIQETSNLDGGDIITTTTTSSDDHIIIHDHDHDEESDDDKEAGECAICLDELYGGDVGLLSECRHEFHLGCIRKWLTEKNNCPLCRALVDD